MWFRPPQGGVHVLTPHPACMTCTLAAGVSGDMNVREVSHDETCSLTSQVHVGGCVRFAAKLSPERI